MPPPGGAQRRDAGQQGRACAPRPSACPWCPRCRRSGRRRRAVGCAGDGRGGAGAAPARRRRPRSSTDSDGTAGPNTPAASSVDPDATVGAASLDDVGDLGRGGRGVERHQDRPGAQDGRAGRRPSRGWPGRTTRPGPGAGAGPARTAASDAVRSSMPAAVGRRARPPVDEHRGSGRAAQCAATCSGRVVAARRRARRPAAGQLPGGRAPSPSATAGHSLAVMTARRIAIVPHTHWDREWYKPYQDFRLALVELLDTLIPLLERDASYPHFMLDGQMAVVDDYLEVRPRERGAPAGPGRGRPGEHGPVVHPHGRVPRLGRDHRAQPADGDRPRARPSAAPWRSATCPTCSATSRRCPRSSGWPGSPTPWCGAACRRRSPRRVHLGGARRLLRAGRVPARRLRQRRRPARRRQGARAADRPTTWPGGRPTSSSATCCS